MNKTNFANLSDIANETTYILGSLEARESLLASLSQRVKMLQGDAQQRLQDWIDDLRQQQLDDIDMYKASLLFPSGISQPDPTVPHSTEEQDLAPINENQWRERFSDGFIEFLGNRESELDRIWLGRKHSYPVFIGFDIRRLSNDFEFYAPDAYWLSAYSRDDKQIFAGFQTRNPYYYQQLESERSQIDFEFSQKFGRNLGWRPSSDISRIIALIGVYSDDYETLFPDLCNILETLDDILRHQLENIGPQRTSRPYPPNPTGSFV